MAREQARDRHGLVPLGEVAEQHDDADVDPAGFEILAAARVERDPLVLQQPLDEPILGGLEPSHERLDPDGAVVVGECVRPVGERRASRERQRAAPRIGAAESFRKAADLHGTGGGRATLALRPKNPEHGGPVRIGAIRFAAE
jgi:hypothetical protein